VNLTKALEHGEIGLIDDPVRPQPGARCRVDPRLRLPDEMNARAELMLADWYAGFPEAVVWVRGDELIT
jgi:hypothetical protein